MACTRYCRHHKALRVLLLAGLYPGQLCSHPRCGKPLDGRIALAHNNSGDPSRTHYVSECGQPYEGLQCARCNESDSMRRRADRIQAGPVRDASTWDCCANDPVAQCYGMICGGHTSGSGRCWAW
jgi:hypothetical protein